jgi:hypothetical protein
MPREKSWFNDKHDKAMIAVLKEIAKKLAAIAKAIRASSNNQITPKMMATIEKIAAETKANQERLAKGTAAERSK